MFASDYIASEPETGRQALAWANNLVALAGLMILGFPVTAATVRTTFVSWGLMAIAAVQFAVRYFTPHLRFEEVDNESN